MPISKTTIDKVMNAQRVEDVIGHFLPLRKKGKDLVTDCPLCNSDKKFSINPVKQIYKCWVCDTKGTTGVDFLMKVKGFTYPDAIKWLADRYNVIVEEEAMIKTNEQPKPKQKRNTESFRDLQLKQSGLSDEDQRCDVILDDNTTKTINLYEEGTLNEKFQLADGDDMIMRYIDLNGRPMKYSRKGFGKEFDLVRVRWQNPAQHLDKNGDPIKYQSPKDSGSALWINNYVRNAYNNRREFDTLYIQEGEKKADKASKHGLLSVGIMGIHNLANNKKLPHEFELLIKFCKIKRVVFVVDSDWSDIGNSTTRAVDQRPKTFLSAINNFKDYFFAFNNIGINLDLFFGYVKKNDRNDKGIDDLLVSSLRGKEDDLKKDFEFAMNEKSGQGQYINCHRITGATYYHLQEYFKLHDMQEFANFHKEKLLERKIFQIGKEKFKFKLDDNGALAKDEQGKLILELAQPLGHDETFWMEEFNGKRKMLQFDYENAYKFLYNRGYSRYNTSEGGFIFIHNQASVVREVKPYEIKDFIIDFTKQLGKKELTNMVYRGGKMYVGPESLANLEFTSPVFHRCGKGIQYLYFQETFWKITNEGIKELPLKELDGCVWNNLVIDFNAKYLGEPMLSITGENVTEEGSHKKKYSYSLALNKDTADKCHFLNFLWNTSNFYWQKERNGEQLNKYELEETKMHFLSKVTAIGYLLHTYRDDNVAKAVIAMDGKISEVGQSNGRSGKSLMGTALQEILPTTYIPGKQKDLTEDKFIFEEVNERTKIVWIDDVRVNLDFEFFFPMITGQMKIEGKGIKRYTLPKDKTPKLLITTNHSINGDSGSFVDRQVLLAFSDFYHKTADGREHRPVDDFGVMFFTEWDYNQRNLFLNFMACCLVAYFKHGIIQAPQERLEKRRLRQQIGEAMLEWAEEYYEGEGNMNMGGEIPKQELYNSFVDRFPKQKMFIDIRDFKKRIKLLCKYKDWILNPGYQHEGQDWGGDNKKNSIEYIRIVDKKTL